MGEEVKRCRCYERQRADTWGRRSLAHNRYLTIFATCINSGNCHCKSGTVCVRVGWYPTFRFRMNATESSTLLLHPCRSSMSWQTAENLLYYENLALCRVQSRFRIVQISNFLLTRNTSKFHNSLHWVMETSEWIFPPLSDREVVADEKSHHLRNWASSSKCKKKR